MSRIQNLKNYNNIIHYYSIKFSQNTAHITEKCQKHADSCTNTSIVNYILINMIRIYIQDLLFIYSDFYLEFLMIRKLCIQINGKVTSILVLNFLKINKMIFCLIIKYKL
jgi:hypothetical protein